MSLRQQSAALDGLFQALGDPARRGMVDRLCRGPASVSELAKPLSMTLSAVVQHLRVLEASGLVSTRKEGRVRTCRLETAALDSVEHWIVARRSLWQARFDRLGEYLAEQDALGNPTKKAKSRSQK